MPSRKKQGDSKKNTAALNSEALLNEKEAAEYLGISPQWLRCSRMAEPSWAGPRFVKISSHVVRYRRRHLDEFLAARTLDPADRMSVA
jgi:predicted DNA-binding transcriptional regulator AlpA